MAKLSSRLFFIFLLSFTAFSTSAAARPYLEATSAAPSDSKAPNTSLKAIQQTYRVAQALTSDDVAWIQNELNRRGYKTGRTDGKMNGPTLRAIRSFQKDKGIPVTGLPSKELMAAMKAGAEDPVPSTASQRAYPPPGAIGFRLRKGFDLPQNDYRSGIKSKNLRGISMKKCIGYCAKDKRCKAFTYNNKRRVCFLKDGVSQWSRFSGATSGIKQLAGAQQRAQQDGSVEAAQQSKTADAASNGRVDFSNAQDPNHVSMLRLYMASNTDLLNNDAFAVEHHTTFGFKKYKDQKAMRRACRKFDQQMDNEVTRRKVLKKLRTRLAKDLERARDWRRTEVFRIQRRNSLKEYDLDSQSFELSRLFELNSERPVSVAKTSIESKRHIGKAPNVCSGVISRKQYRGVKGVTPGMLQFIIVEPPQFNRLPMGEAEAESYIERHGRRAKMEYLIAVGPYVHGAPAPARIIAARALSPDDTLLHEFEIEGTDVEATAKLAKEKPVAKSRDYVQLTRLALHLRVAKDQPALLDKDKKSLENLAARQIYREQGIWNGVDDFLKKTRGGDPNRPMLLIEWPKVSKENPKLAHDLLANIFVPMESNWRFAKKSGLLDQRLRYREKEVFTFRRDEIMGRESRFAGRELYGRLKDQILAAAQLAPTSVRFFVPLPPFEYDFDAGKMVFKKEYSSNPLRASKGNAGANSIKIGSSIYDFPETVKSKAIYTFNESILKRLKSPQDEASGNSAHQHWRQLMTDSNNSLHVQLLAFDRQIAFADMDMAKSEAERWSLAQSRGRGLWARVMVDIEGVEVGRQKQSSGPDRSAPAIIAKLAGVDVIEKDRTLVTSLPLDYFPLMSDVLAEADATAQQVARLKADRDEKARTKKQSMEQKLAALLKGTGSTLLVTRKGTSEITSVYTTGGSQLVSYDQTVRSKSLLLPKGKALTARDMAKTLRDESGAALVVSKSVFSRSIFPPVVDVPLTVSSWPPDRPLPGKRPDQTKLASLVPEGVNMVLVRRRDDQQPVAQLIAQKSPHPLSSFRIDVARAKSALGPFFKDKTFAYDVPADYKMVELRDISEMLRVKNATAFVLRREGLKAIMPRLAGIDVTVTRFPAEKYHVSNPQHHKQGPEKFAILGISGRQDEASARATISKEFEAGQIAEPNAKEVRAWRGNCKAETSRGPGGADQAGAYCLTVKITNGKVGRVFLRQVFDGNHEKQMLKALEKRYGRPFITEVRHLDRGGKRTLYAFGSPLTVNRLNLNRVPGKIPATVLEGAVWVENGATAMILQLDALSTAVEVEAKKAPVIKF